VSFVEGVALLTIVFMHQVQSGLIADGLVSLGCRCAQEDQKHYAGAHGGSMDL
jgi:hypothetical protein